MGLKFRDYGQIYYFDSGAFVVSDGDKVIVNTDQGMSLGQVVLIRDSVPEHLAEEELKSIYRLATDDDGGKIEENEDLAKEAFDHCRACIQEHKLEMKLVDVEVFFDRSKIIFYFTAPNRIDFRELVKDLVKAYRTRIELRQIGVRHETQMIGAVGNCGQVCCCRRFLRKFAPVTIKMAKEQNLFLNPTKISGICGRLLCCLSYEQDMYEQFRRECPKVGKKYQTREGPAKVVRANLFRKSLTLYMEGGEEREVELEEWEAMEPRRYDPSRDQGQQRSRSKSGRKGGRDEESRDGGKRSDKDRTAKNRDEARNGLDEAEPDSRTDSVPSDRSAKRAKPKPEQRGDADTQTEASPESGDKPSEKSGKSRGRGRSRGRGKGRGDGQQAKKDFRPKSKPDQRGQDSRPNDRQETQAPASQALSTNGGEQPRTDLAAAPAPENDVPTFDIKRMSEYYKDDAEDSGPAQTGPATDAGEGGKEPVKADGDEAGKPKPKSRRSGRSRRRRRKKKPKTES